ncbi:MAG TPA: MFS transporter [Desulfobulbaceae bacterium]|nr:MFS transporter [Desulfobulbaceae bacterium]
MTDSTIKYLYFTTIVTFCSLYAAQPIQPVFKTEFQLSHLQAILFTTLMMAPLGVAPLVYGYLLESFSAKVMLRWALFFLGILELIFAMADNYFSLLALRAVQGLMIPAILTSLMSYISYTSPREKVQHAIAAYIAATIVGGFLGRFLSGLFTDLFGWRFFFFVLGLLLLLNCYLLRGMARDAKLKYARPKLREITSLLKSREFFLIYASIFCLFFVFAAMMNFLPFELKQINPSSKETGVGLLYLGYSMGLLVSLNTGRIIRFFGNEADAIRAGILVFALGTLSFMIETYSVMFLGMFVFCAGLFTAHSLLSGLVNRLARDNKAIANGLYISFYYTGGTLGSVLPAVIFQRYGWQAFLVQLLVMIGLAFLFARRLKSAVAAERG